jgi:hypothetical protein
VIAVQRAVPDEDEREQSNKEMRALLERPDPGPIAERLVLLHFHGRRSGREFTVPAGVHEVDGQFVIATGSAWRFNFAGGVDGEITWRGRRQGARFTLVEAEDSVVRGYSDLVSRYGREVAERRLGLVINVDRTPTDDELRAAVQRGELALVTVGLKEGQQI